MSGQRSRGNSTERRLDRIASLVNGSPITLHVADVAKAVGISKPQAASDVDQLLKEGRLDTYKIRRGWKPEDIIRRIRF